LTSPSTCLVISNTAKVYPFQGLLATLSGLGVDLNRANALSLFLAPRAAVRDDAAHA